MKPFKYHIHIWDWKEDTPWDDINNSIQWFITGYDGAHIYQVNTFGDDYAVLITDKLELTQEEVNEAYNEFLTRETQ